MKRRTTQSGRKTAPSVVFRSPRFSEIENPTIVVALVETQAYAEAQAEVESGDVRPDLWEKVTAESSDPEVQRSRYAKYRARQLLEEQNSLRSAQGAPQTKQETMRMAAGWRRRVAARRVALGVVGFSLLCILAGVLVESGRVTWKAFLPAAVGVGCIVGVLVYRRKWESGKRKAE